MAAQKFQFYNNAVLDIVSETGTNAIDLLADGINIALYQSTSNAATLTNRLQSGLTNEVANANGYTTGGIALTSKTLTVVSTNIMEFDSAQVEWTATGGSITARFAVMYANTANPTVIGVFLLDNTPADVTVTDGNPLRVIPSTNGWFRFSINNA